MVTMITRKPEHTPSGWIDRLLRLPRPVRVLLAALPAVAVALLVQPVIDSIYLRFFFDEATLAAPAWLIALLATLMYFAGWVFLVGMPGSPPLRSRGLTLYLIVTAAVFILTPVLYGLQWLSSLG
jgi:hypothetical protein